MNKTIELVGAIINFADSAVITYREISENGDSVTKTYLLTTAEYAQWGNDDNYIKTLIENK
jgi:hypothetical protein